MIKSTAKDDVVLRNRLIAGIVGILLVASLDMLALELRAQEQPTMVTSVNAWDSIDNLLTHQAGKEFDLRLSVVGRVNDSQLLLSVGPDLWNSRIYHASKRLDENGMIWTSHDEQLFGTKALLKVSYDLESGKPLVAPEHNVRLTSRPNSSLKRFGLFPEFYFGFVNSGYELLDLRSEAVRQSFKLVDDGSDLALRKEDIHGSVSLEFSNNQGVLRLVRIVVDCKQSTDARLETEWAEWSGFELDDGGSITGFRLLSKAKWKNEMISEPLRKMLDNGVFSSELLVKAVSVRVWQAEDRPLRFKNIPVPNGFPAHVIGEPGVKYEYHNGELVLVVNQTAEELIQGMREVAGPSRIADGTFWKTEIDKLLAASSRNSRENPDEVAGYCGLYSIAAAAAVHAKSIEFSKLLSSNYIQSTLGSTAKELQQAIDDNGLFGQLVFHASPVYLRNSRSPVLLHLGGNYSSGGPQHWVLYLGQDDAGNAVLLDTPQSIETLPFAVLQTHWDGTAITISDQPVSRVAQVKTWLTAIVPLVVSVLLLAGASLIVSRVGASSLTSAFVLMGIIVVGCVIWSVFDASAYWKNETPVALTESKVRREVALDEVDDVDQLRKEGVLLVDARAPRDFSMGSMPGAVNLPLNPTLGTLMSVVDQAKQAKRVVVYCQSEDCKWSHSVGGKLKTMGIENVSVFRPGWRGFVEQMRATKPSSEIKE